MKNLLELKAEYKHATGKDWKPGATPTAASASQHADGVSVDLLNQQITDAGNHVRKLKAEKAGKVIQSNLVNPTLFVSESFTPDCKVS